MQITQSKFLSSTAPKGSSDSSLSAPMPGIIDKIFVSVGDKVKPGQSIAVIVRKLVRVSCSKHLLDDFLLRLR